jgi:hypothetical protein
MKKAFIFGAISLFLLAFVLSGCQNTVGEATRVTTVNANSCNADTNCEVNQLVATSGIISNAGLTVAGVTKIGLIGISNDAIYKWDGGFMKINNGITVNDNIAGVGPGVPGITVGNPAGSAAIWLGKDSLSMLTIGWINEFVPGGFAKIEAPGKKNLVLQPSAIEDGNVGIGTLTPTAKLEVSGDIRASTLAGNGTAYACVDSTGKIYRSLTACR